MKFIHNDVPYYIVVTRFDESTWLENRRFRENREWNGCYYGSCVRMANSIPVDAFVFVLEMNNTENRIEGIGLVKNHTYTRRPIYSDANYNRYTYRSQKRVDRSQMNDAELAVLSIIETIVFKGKSHMKRGSGFGLLRRKPNKILLESLKTYMVTIMKSYMNVKVIEPDT